MRRAKVKAIKEKRHTKKIQRKLGLRLAHQKIKRRMRIESRSNGSHKPRLPDWLRRFGETAPTSNPLR